MIKSTTPCLVFREHADEAVALYASLIPNSRVISRSPMGAGSSLSFELDGRTYTAFDGGPSFAFAEGFSLMVTCETQAGIDRLWDALTANGGEPGRCGWLKDRFGLSWQVIPADLGRMLGDSEHGDSAAATQAMLKMNKLDVAALRRAYGGG